MPGLYVLCAFFVAAIIPALLSIYPVILLRVRGVVIGVCLAVGVQETLRHCGDFHLVILSEIREVPANRYYSTLILNSVNRKVNVIT
jgi:hypothetical protein